MVDPATAWNCYLQSKDVFNKTAVSQSKFHCCKMWKCKLLIYYSLQYTVFKMLSQATLNGILGSFFLGKVLYLNRDVLLNLNLKLIVLLNATLIRCSCIVI